MEPIKQNWITYTGPSMNPTLKAGDRLHVVPYDGRKIQPGDVIVFHPPEERRKITHRVIAVCSDGIRTRGDNCSHPDPWLLSRDHILGRVVFAYRGKKRRRVFGGPFGRLAVLFLRMFRIIDFRISPLGYPPYLWLAQSRLLKRWLHPIIKTRVVTFRRQKGEELHLLLGHRVIAKRLPGSTQWHIRRPFRLLIDETSLPNPSPKSGVRLYY
jgi:signal peptidase I